MFEKIKVALARFMYGRYGGDDLYNALFLGEVILLFLAAVCSFLAAVSPVFTVISVVLYVLAMALLAFAMFRFFSRNIAKRRRENQAWLTFKSKLTPKKRPKLPPDTATHVFRACPKCRATLRLPRQAGKHQVKCPRCSKLFSVKVK